MRERDMVFDYIKSLLKQWYVKVALVLELIGILFQPFLNSNIPPWLYLSLFGIAFIVANYSLYRERQLNIDRERNNYENRLSHLQDELNELKNRVPFLDLFFPSDQGGSKRKLISISKQPEPPLYEESVRRELEALKKAYAESERPSSSSGSKSAVDIVRTMQALQRGEHKNQDQYEKECKEYLQKYRDYLRRRHNHEIYLARYRQLNFIIENTGTIPADEITILIDFPNEFDFSIDDKERLVLYESYEAPELPKRPSPFKPGPLEIANRMSSFPNISADLGNFIGPDVGPSNISGPFIRPKNSTEVSYEIKNLMHNFSLELDSVEFYVTEEAIGHSWELPYSIHAANLPKPINGSLVVEVQMDTEEC